VRGLRLTPSECGTPRREGADDEFKDKGKGKGNDKGKSKGKGKGGSGLKDTGTPKAVEPKAEPTVEQSVEAQMATATAKNLQFFGISPVPQVEQLKPYPKPTVKAEDSSMECSSEDAVQQLEKDLATAEAHNSPASILNLYKKEIASAKAATAKTTKVSKEISFEALQKRINSSQSSAAAALERHQGHVKTLDEQIAKMQKIRDHSVTDFAASQEAFAARLREDEKELARRAAAVGPPQAATQAATVSVSDLERVHPVLAEDLPPLLDNPHEAALKQYSALWHFYSRVGLDTIPHATFDDVGCKTALIHGLVGDAVWNGFWQEKSPVVRQTDFIPVALHNVLRYQVNKQSDKLSVVAGAKEDSNVRYDALIGKTADAALGYGPYNPV